MTSIHMTPIDIFRGTTVAVIFGLNFAVAKTALMELPPLLLLLLRFGLIALLLLPFCSLPRARLRGILLVSLTLCGVHFPLMFHGIAGVDAATAALAIQLQVPFASLLALVLFRDALGWRRGLGMVIAFAGILVIAGEPRPGENPMALLLVIAASLVFSIANIQIKQLGDIDSLTLTAWMSLFALPVLLAQTLILETGQLAAIRAASWYAWGGLVYMSVALSGIGYGLWYPFLRRYDVNQTMPFLMLVPVFGVAGGVWLHGETLSLPLIGGGVLTLAGVGLIVRRRSAVQAQPARQETILK